MNAKEARNLTTNVRAARKKEQSNKDARETEEIERLVKAQVEKTRTELNKKIESAARKGTSKIKYENSSARSEVYSTLDEIYKTLGYSTKIIRKEQRRFIFKREDGIVSLGANVGIEISW